ILPTGFFMLPPRRWMPRIRGRPGGWGSWLSLAGKGQCATGGMMTATRTTRRCFFVEIIKPSHYDDDGYVIQWWRAFIPSNSLACIHALAKDVAERRALGDDVEVVVNSYDESHTVIPVKKIIRRMKPGGTRGIVLLT